MSSGIDRFCIANNSSISIYANFAQNLVCGETKRTIEQAKATLAKARESQSGLSDFEYTSHIKPALDRSLISIDPAEIDSLRNKYLAYKAQETLDKARRSAEGLSAGSINGEYERYIQPALEKKLLSVNLPEITMLINKYLLFWATRVLQEARASKQGLTNFDYNTYLKPALAKGLIIVPRKEIESLLKLHEDFEKKHLRLKH